MAGPVSKARSIQKLPGLETGDMVAGRYRIERVLGSGSSGFVVAARHVYLRRPVTLKILPLTTNAHERAQREHLAIAHRAAALRGPHVAHIIDTGFTEDGTPFVATERLEGHTLADELGTKGPIPTQQAVRWIMQACEGLAEAHAAGIVHGDLKPSNLFLVGEPTLTAGVDTRIVKVLDFGMTTPIDDGPDAKSTAWLASPAYLSPEQLRDPATIDPRTDIWALAVVLHQIIAGRLPFDAETISGMLVAVACERPALLVGPDVPFDLARIVSACLGKDRSERPADVSALARALAPFAGADGIPLASRVEAALSSPPAPPVDLADAPTSATPEAAENTADVAPPVARSLPPPNPPPRRAPVAAAAGEREDAAVLARQRRRRGAIATVIGAGVLALVGFLAPSPGSSAPTSVTTLTSAAEPPPGAAEDAARPIAKALPVLSPEHLPPPPLDTPPPPARPTVAGTPAAPAPKPVFTALRRDAAPSNATLRGAALRDPSRTPAPARPTRAALPVRDDPYGLASAPVRSTPQSFDRRK